LEGGQQASFQVILVQAITITVLLIFTRKTNSKTAFLRVLFKAKYTTGVSPRKNQSLIFLNQGEGYMYSPLKGQKKFKKFPPYVFDQKIVDN
jgi:Ni,Fe-hydrogenase I cytochrome b subunit